MTRQCERVRSGQRGQTLMIFALAFALFLFALTCLVADGAFLFSWSGRAQAAAQLAAQSGADAVDPRYLYGSPCPPGVHTVKCTVNVVDISAQDRAGALYAFERACIQAGDQSAAVPRRPPDDTQPKTADDPQAPEGTRCVSDGCRVFAVVTRVVQLPIPFPGFASAVRVAGESYAAPVVGTTTPQFGCTGATWVPAPPSP